MADKQGFLTKEGGHFKTWRKRWMVLRKGAIYYSKNQSSGELGIVKLEGNTEVLDSDRKGKKNCFEIKTPGVKRVFYLFAESEQEKAEWVKALKDTVEKKKAGVDFDKKEDKVGLDDFDLLKVIGKGSFGKVIQVAKKDTGKIYAMKVLNKKTIIERNEMEHTKAEKNILQKLVHPFLVNLHYSFQTREKLYFIMDYVNGGELFFHLQQEEKFNEERVRFYAAEILLGLEYLHSSAVLYRDLKPENILLTAAGHICLTDFGISKEGLESDDARTATFWCATCLALTDITHVIFSFSLLSPQRHARVPRPRGARRQGLRQGGRLVVVRHAHFRDAHRPAAVLLAGRAADVLEDHERDAGRARHRLARRQGPAGQAARARSEQAPHQPRRHQEAAVLRRPRL
jgi:tRNA A-37 threonylcarbamoyl transferase component Bud32